VAPIRLVAHFPPDQSLVRAPGSSEASPNDVATIFSTRRPARYTDRP
jgi:hypothetical protein